MCLARVQDMGAQPMNALASMDTLEGMSKPCVSSCALSLTVLCVWRLVATAVLCSAAVRDIALCSRLVRSTLVRPTMPAAADTAEDGGTLT